MSKSTTGKSVEEVKWSKADEGSVETFYHAERTFPLFSAIDSRQLTLPRASGVQVDW